MGPLGLSTVPIMIGALVAMLGGRSALDWLYLGFPLALVVSSAWTVLQLRRQTVEVRVRRESVRVWSAWDAALPTVQVPTLSLVDLRREPGTLTVTLGHDSRILHLTEWPEPSRLHDGLLAARGVFSDRVKDSMQS